MEANRPNNLSFIFICVLVCILGSCNSTHKENFTTFSFNWYNNNDSIVDRNVFELKKYNLDTIDSIVVYNESKLYCNFKEKYAKGKGIYRICNKELTFTHSFSDTVNSLKSCLFKKPFLNQYVLLVGIKSYNLQGKEYRLYHYAEHNNNQSSYDSYYLEGIGFICYYNFDRDDYVLCDSTNIKSLEIREITNELVRDTSFFARYTVAKLFPNFYRVKTHYSKYPTQ